MGKGRSPHKRRQAIQEGVVMASKKTELELLGEINEKLDKIIGLAAIQGISNER